MDKIYFVEIVEVKENGDEVITKRMGPFCEWKADKTDSGVNINLNHDNFYTRIVLDE